jgi:N-acetyl-anhydromuramyl-L-alanine amidase AmpD
MKNKLINRKTTELILVHFTGSKETDYRQIKSKSLQKGILEIGYHYLIEAGGKLLMGRHQSKVGFHYPEFDAISIGIGVAAERDDMTEEQSIALTLLLDKLRNDYPSVKSIKYIYQAP